jgi:hypothetical protein
MSEKLTKAQEITERASSFTTEWAELRKTTAELSEISTASEVGNITAQLGRAGAALGMVSAGISIALIFLPQDDTQAKILEGIQEIENQISQLSADMARQFGALKIGIDRGMAEQSITDQIATIETYITELSIIAKYQATGQNEQGFKDAKARLFKYNDADPSALDSAVTHIVQYFDKDKLVGNILGSVYKDSKGNLNTVNWEGQIILHYVMAAVAAEASIAALRKKDQVGRELNDAELAAIQNASHAPFTENVTIITQNIQYWISQCLDHEKITALVDSMLENDIFRQDKIVAANLTNLWIEVSTWAWKQLAAQWYWYDWTVITYPGVEGWDKHGYQCWDYVKPTITKHGWRKKIHPRKEGSGNWIVRGQERQNAPSAKYEIPDRVGLGGEGIMVKNSFPDLNVTFSAHFTPTTWVRDVQQREAFAEEAVKKHFEHQTLKNWVATLPKSSTAASSCMAWMYSDSSPDGHDSHELNCGVVSSLPIFLWCYHEMKNPYAVPLQIWVEISET